MVADPANSRGNPAPPQSEANLFSALIDYLRRTVRSATTPNRRWPAEVGQKRTC